MGLESPRMGSNQKPQSSPTARTSDPWETASDRGSQLAAPHSSGSGGAIGLQAAKS